MNDTHELIPDVPPNILPLGRRQPFGYARQAVIDSVRNCQSYSEFSIVNWKPGIYTDENLI